jgi:formate hydrogenlyase subunit 4
MEPILHILLAMVFAPLLPGLINRVKAYFAGRKGPPLFQIYYDLAKLLGKGAVYSRTTTWVFRAGPIVGLSSVIVALALVPLGGSPSLVAFPGDIILFVYLFGLLRFFTVLAALDTGSSFEGMGASREVQFSTLAEPALLLGLAALARETGSFSLSEMLSSISGSLWIQAGPALTLIAGAWIVVYLAENLRIPVDDPKTHLELTMVHEVMALDHGGVDFAFILYTSALKLWVLGSLLLGLLIPIRFENHWLGTLMSLLGFLLIAAFVGVVESTMARLRIVRVPQLLVSAGVLSALALILVLTP